MESSSQNLFDLHIDHQGNAHLRDAAKWAKFLSIVGFVFCGLIAVVSIFAGSVISTLFARSGDVSSAASGGIGVFVTVFYLLICLVYFFPCLYLFNFATKANVALRTNEVEALNNSFRNLKACFRFVGILTIIGLVFVVLGVLLQLAALASLS